MERISRKFAPLAENLESKVCLDGTPTYYPPTPPPTTYVSPPVYPPQTPPPATGDGTPPIYDPTNPGGPTTPTTTY
jgi:hypothetical protein